MLNSDRIWAGLSLILLSYAPGFCESVFNGARFLWTLEGSLFYYSVLKKCILAMEI